jgi:hypothetical protein
MSAVQKLRQKMENNPAGNWTMADIIRLLKSYGCDYRNHGSSHYSFFHPLVAEILTIPYNRPIKPIYVRKVISLVNFIDELKKWEVPQ